MQNNNLKTVTFGYRWEGLRLHQWAFLNTDLQAIVLPSNRMDPQVSDIVFHWAEDSKVPLLVQTPLDSEYKKFLAELENLKPDLIICHCYSLKIPKEILDIPRLGCINIHPGKLPKYAGPRPIEAALKAGEKYLRTTIHYMDSNFDTGEIIKQSLPVERDENFWKMRLRLTEIGLAMLEQELL